jgi:MFS family permease
LAYNADPREIVESRALLSEPLFRNLWLTQGLAQTAQNAILFSLLVVILDITNSSVHTSFLILCFVLPSIPLGFIVGVILDRVSKSYTLVLTSLARASACLLFFFFHTDAWVIYAISVGFATAGLFFNPALVSLIPSLVSRERLVPANSLYNFTLIGSQLFGIVFVAPILLKSVGPSGMFLTAAGLFGLTALLAARLRGKVQERETQHMPEGAIFGGIPTEFRESWRTLISDRYSVLALVQLITSSTLVLLFAILIPRYMKDVLEISPDNAAFVFAPTGIGALVGLRFIPWFVRKGKNRAVVIGLLGIGACLVLLALVEPLADVTRQAPGELNPARILRISLLQLLTMSFAGPMGFFYALLNAPAQTILHERAPPEMRGRIFATQVVSANFMSLLPLLAVGAITDLVNITVVLLLLAAIVTGIAALSALVGGAELPTEQEEERSPQEVGT